MTMPDVQGEQQMDQSGRHYWRLLGCVVIVRRMAIWGLQILIFYLALRVSAMIRFDFNVPRDVLKTILWALPIWIAVKVVIFRALGLMRGWLLDLSTNDLLRILTATVISSALCAVVMFAMGHRDMPRSIYLIDAMTCFLLTGGVRLSVHLMREWRTPRSRGPSQCNTLIYGAGAAGLMLIREIRRNSRLPYRVRGFVDDQAEKKGLRLCGLPVLGDGDSLALLVQRHGIEMVLVAIPSATGGQMSKILEKCHNAGVECKTVPGLAEMISGRGLAKQIRDVAVEDLLGRAQVSLEEDEIRASIKGKVILVTGAGGSIGSELCRQIARFAPERIVGFEMAESALFEIDREMRELFPDVPFYPEVGSIQNAARLDEVFESHRPAAVYHAAAYKHVPLMETHVFEAVENNIFGTYNVASAAIQWNVESFVLISTDKAVAPTSVMGATKRITEQLLLGMRSAVKFTAVRFGNVLGSNGSVIPTFKKQIANGGPVTVTHPEMRRFFMTIPEACQLVLQAATIASNGQICVLDMGQPVKIVDLARDLILLSGFKPGEEIKIEFTGIRPGEKLFEELSTASENTLPTTHEKVRILISSSLPEIDLDAWIASLRQVCRMRDLGGLVVALKELIGDYNPSVMLLKRLVQSQSVDPLTLQASSNALTMRMRRSEVEEAWSQQSQEAHA